MNSIIIITAITLLCIMGCVQIILLKKRKKMEMEHANNQLKLSMASRLYDDVYKQNMQMRYLKHDMREFVENHKQYSGSSNTEELLKAVFMAKKDDAGRLGVLFRIENPIWDNPHSSAAEDIFKGWEKEDIISLMNNILNNAIEAAKKCENGSVEVKFRLHSNRDKQLMNNGKEDELMYNGSEDQLMSNGNEGELMHNDSEDQLMSNGKEDELMYNDSEGKLTNDSRNNESTSHVKDDGLMNNNSDVKLDEGKLVMITVNSMRKGYSAVENEFKTEKEDSKEHGYGTKIIRDIVERYDGILEIKEREGEFETIVSFK